MVTGIAMAMHKKVEAHVEYDPVVFTKIGLHRKFLDSVAVQLRDTGHGSKDSSAPKLSISMLHLCLIILVNRHQK